MKMFDMVLTVITLSIGTERHEQTVYTQDGQTSQKDLSARQIRLSEAVLTTNQNLWV